MKTLALLALVGTVAFAQTTPKADTKAPAAKPAKTEKKAAPKADTKPETKKALAANKEQKPVVPKVVVIKG